MKNDITYSGEICISNSHKREKENKKISIGTKILFCFIALIHVGLAVFACIRYKFPVFSWRSLIFISLILLPSGIIAYILITNKKTITRVILLVLCVIYIPVSLVLSFQVFDCSKTNNAKDYLNMDVHSLNVQWLFPENIPTSYDEPLIDKYYYYYAGGLYDTYDVYAERTLSPEEFSKELERVVDVYDKFELTYGSEVVLEMQRGDYKCIIATNSPNELFVDVDHDYTYIIFAYDEQTLRVRYIVCTNLYENKVHHPYYLQLDW